MTDDTLDDLTALLEADYRRLLRWYPKDWRAAHGEVLLGTLMDEAEADDRYALRAGEWRSFAAAGLAARLDRVVMPRVRTAAATLMLSLGVGVSVVHLVMTSWAPWTLEPRRLGAFTDVGPVFTALWVVALIAASTDRWWIGRVALLLSVAFSATQQWSEAVLAAPTFIRVDVASSTFSAACAVLAVIGTPLAGRRLLGAATAWAALTCGTYFVQPVLSSGDTVLAPPSIFFISSPYPATLVLLALGVAVVLALLGLRTPACTVALATIPFIAAIDAAIVTGASLFLEPALRASLIEIGLANIAVLLAVAALVLASQGVVRLPMRRGRRDTSPLT